METVARAGIPEELSEMLGTEQPSQAHERAEKTATETLELREQRQLSRHIPATVSVESSF